MYRKYLYVWLVISLILSLGSTSRAYNLMKTESGATMTWPANKIPVSWYLDQDGSDDLTLNEAESALRNAFEIWDSIPCSKIAFEYKGIVQVGTDEVGTVPIDGRNVMIWMEDSWPAEWRHAIAVCQPVYNPTTGEIKDADIAFDGKDFTWSAKEQGDTSKMDLWNVAAHEIGHLLGLTHPGENGTQAHPEATMNPSSTEGEIFRRYPALDDIFGACKLYPENGSPIGTPCTQDSECDTGKCVEDVYSHNKFCSQTCTENGDCPAPFVCRSDQGVCMPRGMFLSFLGGICSTASPCANEYKCYTYDRIGKDVCTRDCSLPCPEGFACLPLDDGGKGCLPLTTSGAQLGEDCSTESCNIQYKCMTITNYGTRCTRDCPPECPPGFRCMNLMGGGSVCWPQVPSERKIGIECTFNSQCAENLCVSRNGSDVKRCSRRCNGDDECPAGTKCVLVSQNDEEFAGCWPESNKTGVAHIESFTSEPASPAPPSDVKFVCNASSENGALVQIWYVNADGKWSMLSDYSEKKYANMLLAKDGLYTFVCRAKDKYAATMFDDVEVLDFVVDSSVVLPDGDEELDSESSAGYEDSGDSGGCNSNNGSGLALLLAALMVGSLLRRRDYSSAK